MKKYLMMILAVIMVFGSSMTVFASEYDYSAEYDLAYTKLGASYDRTLFKYCTMLDVDGQFLVLFSQTPFYAVTNSDGYKRLCIPYADSDYVAAFEKTDTGYEKGYGSRVSGYVSNYMYVESKYPDVYKLNVCASNYDINSSTLYNWNNNFKNDDFTADDGVFFSKTMIFSTNPQVNSLVEVVPKMAEQTEIAVNNYLVEVMPIIVVSGIGFLVLLMGLPILLRGLRTFLR